MINVDERSKELLHQWHSNHHNGIPSDDAFALAIKRIIREVLEEVKPTPTDYQEWHYYNVAITHMEAKIKELGL